MKYSIDSLSRENKVKFGIAIILIIALTVFFFLPLKFKPRESSSFIIRVRIAQEANTLDFGSEKKCDVSDAKTGRVLAEGISFPYPSKVSCVDGGIKAADTIFDAQRIRISPVTDEFELGGTFYQGEVDIVKKGNTLEAINRVELENYLKGVLPCEMNHLWPFSALKAQAIASRSFAVDQALRRKNKEYDLTDDTYSQVYKGKNAQRWRTNRATDATRGKVLEYKGKVFPGYFHSCCGGHTEDIGLVWKGDSAPLKGVRCRWCRWSPRFRWQNRVYTKELLDKLNEKRYNIKRIDNIKAGPRDPSKRLEYISIKSGNKWFEIDTEDFRSAIGRKYLKSSNFHVKKYPRFYLFSGYGWGHGVGMCQWGAFGLALRGRSTERILKYYYPEANIVRLREILI